jgi:hypothetical protein
MRATVALQMNKKTANGFMAGTGMSYPMSIPASIKGWDQISSLADMEPDRAVQLDNWIPRPGYLEIRRGSQSWATGVGSGPVETIMAYNSPNTTSSKLGQYDAERRHRDLYCIVDSLEGALVVHIGQLHECGVSRQLRYLRRRDDV